MVRARARWLTFVILALATVVCCLLTVDLVLFRLFGLEDRLRTTAIGSARTELLMASRHRDDRTLYVGDSRVLSNVDPEVVSAVCGCGLRHDVARIDT